MTVSYGIVVKGAWTNRCGHSHLWTSVKVYETSWTCRNGLQSQYDKLHCGNDCRDTFLRTSMNSIELPPASRSMRLYLICCLLLLLLVVSRRSSHSREDV
jgi:hypothetical protein